MMKYYQEITLLPSEEAPLYFLWSKVYQQLHFSLVSVKEQYPQLKIGVSFPEYTPKTLGTKLRVFGNLEKDLQQLNLVNFLSKLTDYSHLTSIREVPDNVDSMVQFKRLQQKQNSLGQVKRKSKRQNITEEEAYQQLNKKPAKKLPFINLKSQTSQQKYSLMIIKKTGEVKNNEVEGFNSYGLNYAVPNF